MAPVLIANVLTVTFVYCFAKISQKELKVRRRVALPICDHSSSSCLCFTAFTRGAFLPQTIDARQAAGRKLRKSAP
jgi:hypothetical protein